MRQFRQIDTFGTAWLFVAPHHAERKHVHRRPLGFVAHAGHNLGKRPWLRHFCSTMSSDSGTRACSRIAARSASLTLPSALAAEIASRTIWSAGSLTGAAAFPTTGNGGSGGVVPGSLAAGIRVPRAPRVLTSRPGPAAASRKFPTPPRPL